MQTPNGKPRLSSELMATGDALRQCILQVSHLAEQNNPQVKNHPSAVVLLVDGPHVVEALEVLAQSLAITE